MSLEKAAGASVAKLSVLTLDDDCHAAGPYNRLGWGCGGRNRKYACESRLSVAVVQLYPTTVSRPAGLKLALGWKIANKAGRKRLGCSRESKEASRCSY